MYVYIYTLCIYRYIHICTSGVPLEVRADDPAVGTHDHGRVADRRAVRLVDHLIGNAEPLATRHGLPGARVQDNRNDYGYG